MIPPTHLPSGNALRDLCVRVASKGTAPNYVLAKLMASEAYKLLLPELVLQDVATVSPRIVDSMVSRLFREAQPNPVHQAIASEFPEVFTTNFDLCLEAAGCSSVHHLHGSIEQPGTLQNRLFRLGKTAEVEALAFRRRIEKKTLLILGYSFRDDDIIRLIEKAEPRQIIYISYQGITPPYLRRTKIPWKMFVGSAEDLFQITAAPLKSGGHFASRAAFRTPSANISLNILLYLCLRTAHYADGVDVFYQTLPKLSGRLKYKAVSNAANLLRLDGRFQEARDLIERHRRAPVARKPENADVLSAFDVITGLSHLDEGSDNYREIEELFQRGMKHLDVFAAHYGDRTADSYLVNTVVWKARIMNNLGYLYATTGDYKRAIQAYERSMRIKRQLSEQVGLAQTAVNISVAALHLSNFDYAVARLGEALEIMERTPDFYVCRDAVFFALRALLGPTSSPLAGLRLETFKIEEVQWRKVRRELSVRIPEGQRLIDQIDDFRRILSRIRRE